MTNGNGENAIDTDNGYTYNSGTVIAICNGGGMGGMGGFGGGMGGGMSSENTNCSNFSSIGTSSTASVSSGYYLSAKVSGTTTIAIKVTASFSSGTVIYLGSNSASFSTSSSAPSGLSEVVTGLYA